MSQNAIRRCDVKPKIRMRHVRYILERRERHLELQSRPRRSRRASHNLLALLTLEYLGVDTLQICNGLGDSALQGNPASLDFRELEFAPIGDACDELLACVSCIVDLLR